MLLMKYGQIIFLIVRYLPALLKMLPVVIQMIHDIMNAPSETAPPFANVADVRVEKKAQLSDAVKDAKGGQPEGLIALWIHAHANKGK